MAQFVVRSTIMYVFPRGLRLSLVAVLLIGQALPAVGQKKRAAASVAPVVVPAAPQAIDTGAWLYRGSDIPPDPAWSFGTLPNGVRYAVRRNGVPPGQVAVRVRMDAGSLMETDSERGFAHLIEHLSFRGSEFVPDGEAKRIWQRFGVTFGADTNASTTMTGTVYKLDLPSATEAGLDESLKVLSGMMAKPNITPAALNAELPVVMAEQREQPGAQVHYGDARLQTFFAGQPLAERSPIGTVKTLEGATAETVKAFHDRWYRPERAVVVISGDLDPALFARLIAKNFSDWSGIGSRPAEPDFGKPDPSKPTTAALSEPSLPPIVAFGVVRPWVYRDDTVLMNQNRLVDSIAARIISRRLEQRARGGGSFIGAGVDVSDIARSANGTFVDILPIGDDWAAALRDVRAVIADAQLAPPAQSEIDLELAQIDTQMRTSVETSAAEAGSAQADDMVQAVDIRETTTTAQAIYEVFRAARDKGFFSPERVFAATRQIFTGDATRALINTPTPDETVTVKLAAALQADVGGLAGKRRAQGDVTFANLPKPGPAGIVVARSSYADLGLEQVTFANGVRLLLRPSNSEASRVYVRVRFGGGYNALPANRATPAWAGEIALVAGGIGTLQQADIEQLTASRRIGLNFDIAEDAFSYTAMTSPTDLADQLRLIAARMATPGWDPNPIARAKSLLRVSYRGYDASPDRVVARDLEGLLHAGDPRWSTPSAATVEALTPAAFRKFWEPLLQQGPIEIDVFGDVNSEAAIKAVAESIGALKMRKPSTATVPPVRFPAHNATPVLRTHNGPDNQAAAVIAWPTGGGIDGITESRRLDVLAAIFGDRLFDRLRSEAGASYSPTVQSEWPVGMAAGGRLMAIGQIAPDKLDFFFKLSRQIAAELVSTPVSADELRRTIAPMAQMMLRQSTGSQFWLIQLAGATFDEKRVAALRRLDTDIAGITAAQLQETAAKYLRPDADWTLAVVPKALASTPDLSKTGG